MPRPAPSSYVDSGESLAFGSAGKIPALDLNRLASTSVGLVASIILVRLYAITVPVGRSLLTASSPTWLEDLTQSAADSKILLVTA